MSSHSKEYAVYILTNKMNKVLYTGFSGNLKNRIANHKEKLFPGFTSRYGVGKLVYFETFPDPDSAIAREKQIKGWIRKKKIALIESANPPWKDLSKGWFD